MNATYRQVMNYRAPTAGATLWTGLWALIVGSMISNDIMYTPLLDSMMHGSYAMLLATMAYLVAACLMTLYAQTRHKESNRTPLLPGVVLFFAARVASTVLDNAYFDSLREASSWKAELLSSAIVLSQILAVVMVIVALWMLAKRYPVGGPSVIRRATAAGEDYLREYSAEPPTHTFADLHGNAELKSRLLDAAVAWSEKSKNGVLLFGPPGTGKSVFAEALAGEIKVGIIHATFGNMASRWINQTTEQLSSLFDQAQRQAPVVLFIDEIEALLKSRDHMQGDPEEYGRLVATFLTLSTGLRGTGVLLVAATNHLDSLDPAVVREGRFDFKIEVPLPDADSRRGLINAKLKQLHCATDDDTLDRLVRRWSGFNVPRIQDCAEAACVLARAESPDGTNAAHGKRGQDPVIVHVMFDHFLRALRQIQGRKFGAPEGAKSVDELFLDTEQASRLKNLALRLVDVDRVEQMGGSIPKGVIFFGPPGTGKTAAAMALAKECGWSFIDCTGRELLESGAVTKLGEKASDLRPAIVFIDEADDILGDRRMSMHKSATNELLSLIDGAGGVLHDVVWIAATNHPDQLDSAARRGGRFGQKVEFQLPGKATGIRLIEDWVQRKLQTDSLVIDGDPPTWAEAAWSCMKGLAPADMYQALNDANNTAIAVSLRSNEGRTLTLDLLSQAVADLRSGSETATATASDWTC